MELHSLRVCPMHAANVPEIQCLNYENLLKHLGLPRQWRMWTKVERWSNLVEHYRSFRMNLIVHSTFSLSYRYASAVIPATHISDKEQWVVLFGRLSRRPVPVRRKKHDCWAIVCVCPCVLCICILRVVKGEDLTDPTASWAKSSSLYADHTVANRCQTTQHYRS